MVKASPRIYFRRLLAKSFSNSEIEIDQSPMIGPGCANAFQTVELPTGSTFEKFTSTSEGGSFNSKPIPSGPYPPLDCAVKCAVDPAYHLRIDTKAGEPIYWFPRLFPTTYNSCLQFPPLFYLTQNPVAARPCGFDPRLRHHLLSRSQGFAGAPKPRAPRRRLAPFPNKFASPHPRVTRSSTAVSQQSSHLAPAWQFPLFLRSLRQYTLSSSRPLHDHRLSTRNHSLCRGS